MVTIKEKTLHNKRIIVSIAIIAKYDQIQVTISYHRTSSLRKTVRDSLVIVGKVTKRVLTIERHNSNKEAADNT